MEKRARRRRQRAARNHSFSSSSTHAYLDRFTCVIDTIFS